jgi:hypothetical protein
MTSKERLMSEVQVDGRMFMVVEAAQVNFNSDDREYEDPVGPEPIRAATQEEDWDMVSEA